jgi:hypothetical protein
MSKNREARVFVDGEYACQISWDDASALRAGDEITVPMEYQRPPSARWEPMTKYVTVTNVAKNFATLEIIVETETVDYGSGPA